MRRISSRITSGGHFERDDLPVSGVQLEDIQELILKVEIVQRVTIIRQRNDSTGARGSIEIKKNQVEVSDKIKLQGK